MINRFSAVILSIVMPGLGQIHNKQFLKAVILLVIEYFFNKYSNLNAALMLCLNGHHFEALEIVNYDYALFYPGFYVLCGYDAVIYADNNPNKNGSFLFALAGLSGCLGVVYSQFIPVPVFTVGLLIIILMLIGTYGCSQNNRTIKE